MAFCFSECSSMDGEDYPRHAENRQVIDAGGRLIGALLVAGVALLAIGWGLFGWYEVLPLFAAGQ